MYHGPLPTAASSIALAAWIAEPCTHRGHARCPVICASATAWIWGDIATGVVKPIIDCVGAVWGGSAGAPEGWRMDALIAQRDCEDVPPAAVDVSIWAL